MPVSSGGLPIKPSLPEDKYPEQFVTCYQAESNFPESAATVDDRPNGPQLHKDLSTEPVSKATMAQERWNAKVVHVFHNFSNHLKHYTPIRCKTQMQSVHTI